MIKTNHSGITSISLMGLSQCLYFFRNLIPQRLFQYLAVQTCNKQCTLKLNDTKLHTKHTFHVAYVKINKNKKAASKLFDEIKHLITSSFVHMTQEETNSINTCLNCGRAFVIFAFSANTKKMVVVATVLFSADEHGIWINWLAVSKDHHDPKFYGGKELNIPFRRLGFGKLLLPLVQLR